MTLYPFDDTQMLSTDSPDKICLTPSKQLQCAFLLLQIFWKSLFLFSQCRKIFSQVEPSLTLSNDLKRACELLERWFVRYFTIDTIILGEKTMIFGGSYQILIARLSSLIPCHQPCQAFCCSVNPVLLELESI